MQLATQRWMESSNSWKNDSYTVLGQQQSLDYEYRVKCDEHYYGEGCANLCRPRDDKFGHYTCSQEGDKVCLPGWSGEYCTKGNNLLCKLTDKKTRTLEREKGTIIRKKRAGPVHLFPVGPVSSCLVFVSSASSSASWPCFEMFEFWRAAGDVTWKKRGEEGGFSHRFFLRWVGGYQQLVVAFFTLGKEEGSFCGAAPGATLCLTGRYICHFRSRRVNICPLLKPPTTWRVVKGS